MIFSKKTFEAYDGYPSKFQNDFQNIGTTSFPLFLILLAGIIPILFYIEIFVIVWYLIFCFIFTILFHFLFENRKVNKIKEIMNNKYSKCLKCKNFRVHHDRAYCIHGLQFFKYFIKGELSSTKCKVNKTIPELFNTSECEFMINNYKYFNRDWKELNRIEYKNKIFFGKLKILEFPEGKFKEEFFKFFNNKSKYH